MRKGSGFWLRNKGFARFMSVFVSVTMVLSLLPSAGVEEARNELLMATAVAQETEGTNSTTDPGGRAGSNNAPAGSTTDGQSANGTDASKDAGASSTTPENSGSSSTNNNQEATEGTDETKTNSDSQNTEGNSTDEQNQGEQKSEDQNKPEDQTKVDETPRSANLADFITEAVIEGAQKKDDKLVVNEGESYNAKLIFAERDDKQFVNEQELTFALPQGFVPDGEQPASHDALVIAYADDNGERQNIELGKDSWWIDGTTIHMVWKVPDAETRSEEEVAKALQTIHELTDVEFSLSVVGTFAAGTKSVDFGTGAMTLNVASAKKADSQTTTNDNNEDQQSQDQNTNASSDSSKGTTQSTTGNANSQPDSQKSLAATLMATNIIVNAPKTFNALGTKEAFDDLLLELQANANELANFLTNAEINAPTNASGAYVVTPDTPYSIRLSFAEQPDGLQFPEPGTEMTYTIPTQITDVANTGGTFTINVTDTSTGQVYPVTGNTYSFDSTGRTITVKFNQSDGNIEQLKKSANVRFNISFNGEVADNTTKINFGNNVEKDVVVDNSSNVTVNKTGYFDLAKNKVHYTVTVYSTGKSTNVSVWDKINDSQNVITGVSNFHYNSNMRGQDFTEGVTKTKEAGTNSKEYDFTFATMSKGETITFTYDGDIDSSKIPIDSSTGKVTYTAQNQVLVEKDGDGDPTPVTNNTVIDYTPKLTKTGVVSEDGKEITYTVTYNSDGLKSMKGNTLTDTIRKSSQQYLKFPAQTMTVDVYQVKRDANGNVSGETKVETRQASVSEGSTISYQVPSDDPAYKYVLTFKAQVQNTSSLHDPITVYNDVEVPGNKTSDGETIQPENGVVTVDKQVKNIDLTNKEVTWTSTFTVPKDGLTTAVATDTYPETWMDGTHIYESIMHDSTTDYSSSNNWQDSYVTVTGLKDNEHVTVAYNDANAVFTFYKNTGTTEQGINGGNDIRTVTLTYKTSINDTWYENWTKAPGHTNSINFDNKNDSDTAYIVKDGVDKSDGVRWGTRMVDGTELPIYQYVVELNNVTKDNNIITDEFDTTLLEPFNPEAVPNTSYTKTGGDDHSWWAWRTANSTYNARSNSQVTYVSTASGMTIYTNADSMVHDTSTPTGFYPQTKLVYYLTVKDAAAMLKLQNLAAGESTHKYTINNTVKWNDQTDGGNVEYEYPALDKEILTSDTDLRKTDQDIWARYRIRYNPAAATLNGGAAKDMTDTVRNLSIDISSITISPSGTGITYDMEGDVLTFKNVPDSTAITIEYNARVKFDDIGQGGETVAVNFDNTVKIPGFEDVVKKTAYRTNSGAGAGEIYSVNLMKYQAGNMDNKLNGAEFTLYHAKPDASSPTGFSIDENNPVVDKSKNPVTFTTGAQTITDPLTGQTKTVDGMIVVKGNQDTDGWTINADTYYFLKETKAPKGYMLANFDYAFMVSADGTTNYSKYIYHSGDTLSAKNYKGTDLNVLKDWSDGEANHESDTVTVRLQQRHKTGDDPETWSDWSNTIRRQVDGNWVDVTGDVEGQTILTLSKNNGWKGTFPSLPNTVPQDLTKPDGDDWTVDYQIREWKINSTDADAVVTANAGNGENGEYHWSYQPTLNGLQITNTPLKGSLKLTKLVTVNGDSTNGTLADGTYTFTVAGPAGATSPVTKTVTVTIENGTVKSATLDGKDVPTTASAEVAAVITTDSSTGQKYVELTDLNTGDYTITETASSNVNATLANITGGKNDGNVGTKKVTATVAAGKSGDQTPVTGISSFTNNVPVGSLKLKKNLTVNGVPLADAVNQGFAENSAVDGTYTFQVWRGNYNAGDKIGRIRVKFEQGAITTATYNREGNKDGNNQEIWDSITINDDGTVQLDNLAPGLYTIHELEGVDSKTGQRRLPDGVSLVGGNQQGGNNKQVTVTANNTTTVPTAELTNNKTETGDLQLSKEVVSANAADKDTAFNFKVVLSDNTITGNYGGMTFENGIANVILTGTDSGKTVTATGLPTGVTYSITESSATGFSLTGITTNSQNQLNAGKATGTITKTKSEVEFKNSRDQGNLRVNKIVANPASGDNDKEFTFTVTLVNSTITGDFGDKNAGTHMRFNNGVATFTLKHNQFKLASGLPANQVYTVTETAADGFTTTWSGNTSDTIVKDDTKEVTATNTRNYGNLQLDKTVVSNSDADDNIEFTFTVTLSDSSINNQPSGGNHPYAVINTGDKDIEFNNGVATVTLKHGQRASIKNLPEGTTYTVTEAHVDGFATGSVNETGTITKNGLSKVEFTNTRAEGGLVLQKRVVSNDKDDEGKYFTFVVSLLNNDDSVNTSINQTYGDLRFVNGVATVLLKHGDVVVSTGIPENTKFKIEEVNTTRETAQTANGTKDGVYTGASLPSNKFGLVAPFNTSVLDGLGRATSGRVVANKITTGQTSARYSNTRINGRLTVSKELITKAAADENQEFTFHVNLYTQATDTGGTLANVNGTYGGMTFTNGQATVKLKGGQSVSAEEIPAGLFYRVTEDSVPGFTAEGSTTKNGPITASGATAAFKNKRNDTQLPIHKTLHTDVSNDLSKTVTFTVRLTGLTDEAANASYPITYEPEQSGWDDTIKFTNGIATLEIPGNATATIKELPEGVGYAVTENIMQRFINSDIQNSNGTLVANNPTVEFVNDNTNGQVTVTKELINAYVGDEEREFDMTIRLANLTAGNKTYDGVTFVQNEGYHTYSFKLKSGESRTFKGLPSGARYDIIEDSSSMGPQGIVPYGVEYSGSTDRTTDTYIYNDTPKTALVRNLRTPSTLALSKKLVSEATADKDQLFTFDVAFNNLTEEYANGTYKITYNPKRAGNTDTIKLNNGRATITLVGDQTATIGYLANDTSGAKGLPNGATYTITERSANNFKLTGITGTNNGDVGTRTVTGTLPQGQASQTFTNQRLTGGFSLTKKVLSNTNITDTTQFDFIVRLTGASITSPSDNQAKYGTITRKDGSTEPLVFANSVATFKLADGDKIYAEGLPLGTTYTISEARNSTYTTTISGVESSKVNTNDASYVLVTDTVTQENNPQHTYNGPTYNNTHDEGSLSVNKTVSSNYPPDYNYEFEFTVELDNTTINNQESDGTYPYPVIASTNKPIPFVNGKATFKLKHNETASIKGLPTGIGYHVTEKAADGFVTTWSGNTNGTITKNALASVTARNRNVPGTLDVSKTVISHTDQDYSRFYPFKVFFFTEMPDEAWVNKDGTLTADGTAKLATDVAGTYDIVNTATCAKMFDKNYSNGIAEFTMEGNRTAKFADLPQALYYLAYEVTPDGFQLQKSGQVGKIAATNKANFYNTRVEGGFYVGKSVRSSLNADKTKSYHFKVTLYTDSGLNNVATNINGTYAGDTNASGAMNFTQGVADFDLRDNEVGYALNLPLEADGLYYKVEESDYSDEGFKTYVDEVTADKQTRFAQGHITAVSPVTTTLINVRQNGNLKVTKSNQSDVKDGQKFNFKVQLSDKTINGTYGGMTFNDGVATFTLGKGESLSTADENYQSTQDEYYTLPVGIHYTVTETHADGYTTTWSGTTQGKNYAYSYSQQVTGPDNGMYDINKETKTLTYGDQTSTLEREAQKNLGPIEGDYTYATWDKDDAVTTWTSADSTVVLDPAITANTTDEAVFTNTREYGGIKVAKEVKSALDADKTKKFGFRVELADKSINGTYGEMNFTNGVATFQLASGESKATNNKLPKGMRYAVYEEASDGFEQWGGNITGTIGFGSDGGVELVNPVYYNGEIDVRAQSKYTNNRESGKLQLYKSVTSALQSDKTQEYEFTVKLEPATVGQQSGDNYTFTLYRAVADDQGMKIDTTQPLTFTNGVATLKLKDGQSAIIGEDSSILGWGTYDENVFVYTTQEDDNLPVGLTYTVEEATPSGMTATWSGKTGKTALEPATISDVNIRQTGGLTVSKQVISDASADKTTQKFTFTVALYTNEQCTQPATDINGVYGTGTTAMDFEDGVAEVELTHDQSVTATGLPDGLYYKITEAAATDFELTGITVPDEASKSEAERYAKGVISQSTSSVTFENTRLPGNLVLSKALVSDATADKNSDFTFFVRLSDNTISKTYPIDTNYETSKQIAFQSGFATVTLKGGEVASAAGLPRGVGYTITEANAPGFTLVKNGDTGTISQTTSTATFTNTREVGDLTVSKQLLGATGYNADENREFDFTVTLSDTGINKTYGTGDTAMTFTNGVANFKLKHNQSKTAVGLPTGIRYTVTEADAPGFVQYGKVGVTGTIATTPSEAIITNIRPGKPTFDKKIKDLNDSTGETSDWQDSADYDIGDAVPYKLTATLSKDVTAYKKYHITFTDKMEDSLDFNEDSVRVELNGTELASDKYVLTKVDDHNFTVRLDWEGVDDAVISDTSLNGARVDVYFTATLNQNAKLGKEGNVNACKLTYSSNPDVEKPNEEEDLPWDYVIAFTYKVDVNKVDQDGNALEGAEFKLEKINQSDGSVLYQIGNGISLASVEGNVFSFTGLDDGIYKLTETKTPTAGYKQMEPITFTVTAGHALLWDYLTSAAGNAAPIFDVTSRHEILTTLTGSEDTGALSLQANEELSALTGDVKNESRGALKIKKNVIENGQQRNDTALNGTYHFTVVGPNDEATTRNVTVEVTDGKSGETQLNALAPGIYTVAEDTSKNPKGMSLIGAKSKTVEVKDAAADEQAVVETVEFTNTKPGKPGFDKKIKDTNDSTGETSDWQDSADYDIGDAVPYKLTATLPKDVTAYKKYHITFTDKMEDSLTFKEIEKVTVNATEVAAKDYTFNKVDDHNFTLRLDWQGVDDTNIADESLNGAKVEVFFSATLNENAKLGKQGNANACKLTYSNNPEVDKLEQEDELPWDYVIAFTYKMDISKVDAQAKALTGAEFKLEKLIKGATEADDKYEEVKRITNGGGENKNVFTATGLDDGIYRLTETKAPDGYNPIDPITFTVTAEHGATWDYTSDAKADPAFSPDSRNSILTALTGSEETGMLALTANSDLSVLAGSVINSKEGGNLAVKKKVSSTRSEDKTRNYGFKVTLGDKTINGKYGDMEFKDGVATFTLKDNETKRAAALPLNEKGELKYEVVETDAGGLTSSMGNPVKSKDGLTHTVTCTNTYKKPTSSTSRSSTAKTGDSTNYVAVGVFAIAGVAIIAGALINKRRRNK